MDNFSINAENVSKKFATVTVFKNISFAMSTGNSLAVTGPNGSGKSTLLQVIAGFQRPSSGRVIKTVNSTEITGETFPRYCGFTGPQVNPYDMLTAAENLAFTSTGPDTGERINSMLDHFDLYRHRDKLVKYFSSGMKQRLKIIHALINEPGIIFLDEPGSNLDYSGKDKLFSALDSISKNRIIIIASNEENEINLCGSRVELGKPNS